MMWTTTEESAYPEVSRGRVRIRMKFAWTPVAIHQQILWLENYVLVEEFTCLTSDVCYEYAWQPIHKILKFEPEEVKELFKKGGIMTAPQLADLHKDEDIDSLLYAKVYNYLDMSSGPIYTRKEPEILWYKVGVRGKSDYHITLTYLSKLLGKSPALQALTQPSFTEDIPENLTKKTNGNVRK